MIGPLSSASSPGSFSSGGPGEKMRREEGLPALNYLFLRVTSMASSQEDQQEQATWPLVRPRIKWVEGSCSKYSGGKEGRSGEHLASLCHDQFSSVQSLSRVQLFATPWTEAYQASLSITNSQSLLKLMFIKLVMPCNHLILCRPLLLLLSIFPSIRVFSNESVLCIRWPKYWSFSFSINPSNKCVMTCI